MAADWDGPELTTTSDEHTTLDSEHTTELATPEDIQNYRSVRPEPDWAPVTAEDFAPCERDRDNEITKHDLKPSYRPPGASGSGDKGPKKELPRLTPQQRIDRHEAITKSMRGGNFLPETDTQRAERELSKAAKKAESDEKRKGRPRKGKEIREVVSARVAPETISWLKGEGLAPGDVLDEMVKNMKVQAEKQFEASLLSAVENLLTGLDGRDNIAA